MTTKVIETPWGIIKTPGLVYFIGFSMILFSMFTIDFGKFAKGVTFLAIIFGYFREVGVLKLGLLSTLMRFGFDMFIFGGLWKIAGKLGFTNESRHHAMIVLCLFVSGLIIKLANWEEGVIVASIRTIFEIINSIVYLITAIARLIFSL